MSRVIQTLNAAASVCVTILRIDFPYIKSEETDEVILVF